MSYPLQKRPKSRMGVRQVESKESPRHRKFVRSFVCAVSSCATGMPIQCAHIRDGLPCGEQAGMGQKPHDMWTVPLCHQHHAEYDNGINGSWKAFEKKYGLDLKRLARHLASASKDEAVREYAKRQSA